MSDEELIAALRPLNGLWTGMLDDAEMKLVKEAELRGLAFRSYGSPAGVFGLSKLYIAALNEPQP